VDFTLPADWPRPPGWAPIADDYDRMTAGEFLKNAKPAPKPEKTPEPEED